MPRTSTPPWRITDPAEVDRYLASRGQPPRPGESADPVPTTVAPDQMQRFAPPTQSTANFGPGSGSQGRQASAGQGAGRGEAPPPAVDPTDPQQWLDPEADPWSDPFDEMAPDLDPAARGVDYGTRPPRRARTAGQRRARAARTRPPRPLPRPTVPGFIRSAALVADPVALAILAVCGFGLAVMAATMGSRVGSLPDAIVIHFDAAGNADRWGPPKTLWRLPLMTAMVTLMSLVGAWFAARRDPFAGRFLLAAALGVQVISWVAVIRFLW